MGSTTHAGTIQIPEAAGSLAHSSVADVDRAIEEVAANRGAWIRTTVASRIALIDEMLAILDDVAADWVAAAAQAKGLQPGDPRRGEDWFGGPTALGQQLDLLRRALVDIEATGRPALPGKPTLRATTGQVTVPTVPVRAADRLMFPGLTAHTHLMPGVSLDAVRQAAIYTETAGEGGVCAVLGAGNVNSIAPTDVMTKLFNDNLVTVLKMNPVNEYSGTYLEQVLGVLVRRGFLRFVYGGVEVGKRLTTHPLVTHIHMTGSDKTHDAVVWGVGDEGERNRANRTPITDKLVTSELGNVTPAIIVPGPWSKGDLRFQAGHLAGMLTFNGGFNCISTRVMIHHAKWNQRREFMDAFTHALGEARPRLAYYPGARDRWAAMTAAHPSNDQFGVDDGTEGCVPWTLLRDLDPDQHDDIAFTTEAFNGVMGEVAIDAPMDIASYLDQAVDFCNDVLWGTLGATFIVHPRTMRNQDSAAAVERALDRLQYGSIVVNEWAGAGFGFMSTPWGAFPGHPLHDIRSGRGFVHNTLMVEDVQKTVFRAPFRSPTGKWGFDPSHRTLDRLGPAAYQVWGRGRLKGLPAALAAALRG